MRRDISSRKEVEELVNSFYDKVLKDDLLAPIFLDIAKIDLNEHFPHLYDFWESILLGAPNYKRNPMVAHIELNKKVELNERLFQRWLKLFTETVDELFTGAKAEEAKLRANSIAQVMQLKISQNR